MLSDGCKHPYKVLGTMYCNLCIGPAVLEQKRMRDLKQELEQDADEHRASYFPLLSTRLREERQLQRWSLSALAKEAGISKTYLWELEQDLFGKKSPSAFTVYRLACVLCVGMDYLLGVPDPREPGSEKYPVGFAGDVAGEIQDTP